MRDLFTPPPLTIPARKPCTCGSTTLELRDGVGPHAAGLRCDNCGRFHGWLSKAEYEALKNA